MKHTKIVATIGPASMDFEKLKELAAEGVDVFRLNFSHGNHEWHGEVIKKIKTLNRQQGSNHAILLDTKGPEIRTGDMAKPVIFQKGQEIIFSTQAGDYEKTGKIGVNYDGFVHDVEVGERVMIDSGVINAKILKKTETDVVCEILDGGEISSRRHINIPGKDVSLESITEKDWDDITFGIEMGVDFIALSFVRRAADIELVRDFIKSKNADIAIMAKIESFEATRHLEEIIEASDAVMVARGDLGAEVPFARVPQLQREILQIANQRGKPVIVATHMLESMIENPIPTRAEVTDIAHAVEQKTDAVMLSGETAGGKFPILSVQAMRKVIDETETHTVVPNQIRDITVSDDRMAFAKMAAEMASSVKNVFAIVVITRSGLVAHQVSQFRPGFRILAFTNEAAARRKMSLYWGIRARKIEFSSNPETTISRASEKFLRERPEYKGKKYILISDIITGDNFIPTLQVREF